METIKAGGYAAGFCTALGAIRGGIGLYNAAVAASIISGTALATGGLAIAVIVASCAVYGAGNAWGWWS
ncbi:MAG: hypothetical protein EAZ80_10565 [Runella slithyformis]|nr:MAG: hypothetical protein EAZ80_10565 [Runella slithyformis]